MDEETLSKFNTTVKKAMKYDNDGQCIDAIKLYAEVSRDIIGLVKFNTDLSSCQKTKLTKMALSYVNRAEKLKNTIETIKQSIDPAYRAAKCLGSFEDSHTESHDDMMQRLKALALQKTFKVTLDEIVGNRNVKTAIEEGVIFPITKPDYFSEGSNREPANMMFLFGPPGVGKSSLARAAGAATMGTCSFFNLKPSFISSAWQGQSVKLIAAFFDMVRNNTPAIVLADEIEGFFSSRNKGQSTNDMVCVAELLDQLDNDGDHDNSQIFFIACSNNPPLVDKAFVRRFSPNVGLHSQ